MAVSAVAFPPTPCVVTTVSVPRWNCSRDRKATRLEPCWDSTRGGRHRRDDGRRGASGHARRRCQLQREIAGDVDGRGGLFRWISDALRRDRCGCCRRKNSWCGVVAVQVHAAAGRGAGCPGEAPTHGSVGMASAADGGVKGLDGAELDVGVWRCRCDRDVARYRE